MSKSQLAPVEALDGLDAYVTSTKERCVEPGQRPTIWEPSATASSKTAPVTIPFEQAMVEVIVTPIAPGEQHREGNVRKERQLAALLEKLTPAQSLALTRRLDNAIASDPLVVAFDRLVPERRVRLLAYLARRRTIAVTLAQR